MGVVLNRPSPVTVDVAVPPLASLVEMDDVVHVGGPVQSQAIVVLGDFHDPADAAALVVGSVGFLRGEIESADDVGALARARVFAGYAGWGPGQLEGEIAESSWIIEPATPRRRLHRRSGRALERGAAAQGRAVRGARDDSDRPQRELTLLVGFETKRSMTSALSTAVAARLDRRGIHYGWVIAAVSFLTLITAAGFRSTVGVLIVPLQDEFGWSRATISAAVAINLVLYGLGGPFAAGLYDRFGIRKVIVLALATIAISSTLTTQMEAPLAARRAVGRRERPRHGRDRRHTGGRDREPLVRRAARPRHGHAHCQQRHGPARVPAAARLDRHGAGVANGRAHGVLRRIGVHASARLLPASRQPGGRRAATVRRQSSTMRRLRRSTRSGRRSEASSPPHAPRRSGCSAAASSSAARRRMG